MHPPSTDASRAIPPAACAATIAASCSMRCDSMAPCRGPSWRAATGLTPQAIANIVEDLIAAGLVREAGRRKAPRGQPPIAHRDRQGWRLCDRGPDRCHALPRGRRRSRRRLIEMREGPSSRASRRTTPGSISRRHPCRLCRPLRRRPLPRPRAGDAGTVRYRHGRAARQPGASRRCTAAPSPISSRRGSPPTSCSRTTPRPRRSARSSMARRAIFNDFFYVFIGEGVGGGIVIRGEPYRGNRGNAGEFGHLIVDPGGPRSAIAAIAAASANTCRCRCCGSWRWSRDPSMGAKRGFGRPFLRCRLHCRRSRTCWIPRP